MHSGDPQASVYWKRPVGHCVSPRNLPLEIHPYGADPVCPRGGGRSECHPGGLIGAKQAASGLPQRQHGIRAADRGDVNAKHGRIRVIAPVVERGAEVLGALCCHVKGRGRVRSAHGQAPGRQGTSLHCGGGHAHQQEEQRVQKLVQGDPHLCIQERIQHHAQQRGRQGTALIQQLYQRHRGGL